MYCRCDCIAEFLFVSVLLFGVAGWKSLTHGVSELRAGGHSLEEGPAQFLGITGDVQAPVDPFWIAVAILLGAVVFESYAFLKARAELRRQMQAYGWSGYRKHSPGRATSRR